MQTITRRTIAIESFVQSQTEALSQLDALKALIEQAATQQAAAPKNWGYAGTMAHVNEQLGKLVASLTETTAVCADPGCRSHYVSVCAENASELECHNCGLIFDRP